MKDSLWNLIIGCAASDSLEATYMEGLEWVDGISTRNCIICSEPLVKDNSVSCKLYSYKIKQEAETEMQTHVFESICEECHETVVKRIKFDSIKKIEL